MSMYILPHAATMREIKHYATGNGRIVWTYKGKTRSHQIARAEAKRDRKP